MKKTIKIPSTLFRAGTSQITARAEGDASPTLRMSISSDVPYLRQDWDGEQYYEVLSHDAADMDMSRLKAGTPLLFNHDRDIQIGRNTSFQVEGGKCYVESKISAAPDVAGYKTRIEEGILVDTSVGYQITDEGTCTGQKDGIPIYKFKWAPYEASMVTVPADISVGAGRQRAKEGEEPSLIAINLQKGIDVDGKKQQSAPNSKRIMTPEEIEAERQKVEVIKENARKEALQGERERRTEITKLRDHFRNNGLGGRKIDTDELAEKFANEGKSAREFQDAVVMGSGFKDAVALVTPTANEGMKEKDISRYSVVRAIRCLSVKGGKGLDGLEGEMNVEHAKRHGLEITPTSFFIPFDVMRAPQPGVTGRALTRALTTNVFSAAGALVGTELLGGSMIELLRNKMFTVALGARLLSGLVGNIDVPKQTGGATASWLSENATVSASNQTVGQLHLTPHRLSALTAFTTQLLAQASVDVETFVREDLMKVIAIARDLAAIAGTGNAGQPIGILNTSGLSTSVTLSGAQSMVYADALAFENNVALNNADQGSLAYLATPAVRKASKSVAEISAANSLPVWRNVDGQDMVNGYPARATNQVPTATSVIYGNWDDLILADWASNQVIVDPYSLGDSDQVRIIMRQFADNGLRHATSFSVSTN